MTEKKETTDTSKSGAPQKSAKKTEINLRFRKNHGGILQELFHAVLDEQERYETFSPLTHFRFQREYKKIALAYSISADRILKESEIAEKRARLKEAEVLAAVAIRTKEKYLKQVVPAFCVKSIETLNEIGKSYPAQSAEEVFLCKKLTEYNKCTVEPDFIIEKTSGLYGNRIEITIHKPVRQFIDKYYADIIAIKKQYGKEDGDATKSDILKNLDLSQKNRTALASLQKLFEDGANKYPRLIHLVLEWPLFSRMPKPPRDMLSFCDQQEYNRMLKRQKIVFFDPVDCRFSGMETQSTHWFLYPKGESWNKDSGIARFKDLFFDTSNLLHCDWLKFLHKHIKPRGTSSCKRRMIGGREFVDDWDGLFDEDYDFQEEGYRKGLYKYYYITDVFYESIRLCRKLLDSEKRISEDEAEDNVTPAEAAIVKSKPLWTFKFNGESVALGGKLRGLKLLEILLTNPSKEYYCLELLKEAGLEHQSSTASELIYGYKDQQLIKNNIEDLRAACDGERDPAKQAEIKEQIERAEKELGKATNRTGKSRSISDKHRIRVSDLIGLIFNKIKGDSPKLYNHFAAFLKCGTHCYYKPDKKIVWNIE